MRKIIDRKIYDTATSEKIVRWSNSYPVNDFNWAEESLYRTKAGNWFIYGRGGPNSGYAEPCGTCRTGGSDIRPLDGPAVIEWLERTENYDELEALFPDSVEEA